MASPTDLWLPGGIVARKIVLRDTDRQALAKVPGVFALERTGVVLGMSRDEHREKMPNYLLQWEAIRRAKALGCKIYNLWGAPNEFDESDDLWGVFRFKEGLGGTVLRTIGAWDFPASPLMYKLYTQTLPRIMDVMRTRGKTRTRQSLGA